MFSCPFLPCRLSLSVIPHIPGHLSVQYAVFRAPQLEVSKGITLSQEPFLSSVGNSQSLEQEISYSISKAPSIYLLEVPTSGCELCSFLRAGEEGYVSFPVPGLGPRSPHANASHRAHWTLVTCWETQSHITCLCWWLALPEESELVNF